MQIDRAIPILRIFDEESAKSFYLDFMGFNLDFEHRFEADMPLYMGVSLDGLVLHLSGHFGDTTPGTRVYISVSDGLDDFARKLAEKRYKFARPGCPEDTPWGSRELTVHDPFGNRLTFAERVGT